MISHLFRRDVQAAGKCDLGFDNFTNLNPAVPKSFHPRQLHQGFHRRFRHQEPFYNKRVVLLAQDPRDVAVSQFFQWKFRIKPSKVTINNYPPRAVISACSIS